MHKFHPYFKKDDSMKIGYYLVRESDQKRFFISAVVDAYQLNKIADLALNDLTGYDYWVDRYIGKDINGNDAWMNEDHTDRFI